MTENISYQPTSGITYDPEDALYWDPAALNAEIERTFEICHGCRMCFKYCDSFPSLFSFIDDRHDGDVRKITDVETAQVMDECFQCKLCEVQCPYTVRESHEFQLDFPKLVHRYKAQRYKVEGPSVRDRILGDPDRLARFSRVASGLVNSLNSRSQTHRFFLDKVLGIHQKKRLPRFAKKTFTQWAKKHGFIRSVEDGEVVIFPTCYVENNEPAIGHDTVSVLEKNGVDVSCESGLECCGMPAWESGDLTTLRAKAKNNLARLLPHVSEGKKVVVILEM